MNAMKPHHQPNRREIKTHALRRATSMPMRSAYGMESAAPVVSAAPVSTTDSLTRVQRSATVVGGAIPPLYMGESSGVRQMRGYSSNNSTVMPLASSLLTSSSSDSDEIEILFSHPYSKIISFTISTSSTSASSQQLLPFTNSTDHVIATGSLKLYRAKPHNVAFIQSGTIVHPVMARSACWCVKEEVGRGIWGRGRGRGVFVLRIRLGLYWRVEINETGLSGAVEDFKKVLGAISAFEKDECPFARVATVFVGADKKEEEEDGWKAKEHKKQTTTSNFYKALSGSSFPMLQSGENYKDRRGASRHGLPGEYPVHSPLHSPNFSPVLESFDDILPRPLHSLSFSNLSESRYPTVSSPEHAQPICMSPSANSSCDSLALSLSSSYTYSTSASYASSPLASFLVKSPAQPGSSDSSATRRPRTFSQPWVISAPMYTTITTTTTSQTVFSMSSKDDRSSDLVAQLSNVLPQPPALLMTAAEVVIGKPSKYLVDVMLRIAKSVVGGGGGGDVSPVEGAEDKERVKDADGEDHGAAWDGQENRKGGNNEEGAETEDAEDDYGFRVFVGSGIKD